MKLHGARQVIEAINLCKSFGSHVALNDVTFAIAPGEVVGFLGPNGAGKTTTLRILTGFLAPTSGTAQIAGYDVRTHGGEARRLLGYMPERIPFYGDMKVKGYLHYVAELKEISRGALPGEVSRVLEWSGARPVADRLLSRISHGFRQRVALAQALLGKPAALLLDEPTGGLDPEQAADFRELICGMQGECAVLLSTHILPEASRICDRVMILDGGRLVAVDRPERLAESAGTGSSFRLLVKGDLPTISEAIKRIPGCLSISTAGEGGGAIRLDVETDSGGAIASEIARVVLEAGGELLEMNRSAPSLEDVFLRLTRDEEDPGD